MKYVYTLIFFLACLCQFSFAQSSSTTIDTLSTPYGRYGVVTNRFFDNWFISAGAGAQMFFGDHNKQMDFSDRLTPVYEVNIGKWFSPGIGTRIGVNGLRINGLTQNGSYSTGEVYDASQGLSRQEIPYYHVHGDVLFNLTNIFGGYRERRFWDISPYVGLGFMVTREEPVEREISANIGILNSFRLGRVVDLIVDVRGAAVNDRFDGEIGGRKFEGLLSASAGLSFKLPKQGWDKPVLIRETETVHVGQDELASLRAAQTKLLAELDELRRQLADAKGKTATEVVVEKSVLAAPILVTFPINKSTVSNEARVNLGFFADVIKSGSSDVVYKVTGYADRGTGTKAINERLSRARAVAIRDVLVNEFGVPAAQLEIAHEGGVDNMFYDDPRLSRAVITRAQ